MRLVNDRPARLERGRMFLANARGVSYNSGLARRPWGMEIAATYLSDRILSDRILVPLPPLATRAGRSLRPRGLRSFSDGWQQEPASLRLLHPASRDHLLAVRSAMA